MMWVFRGKIHHVLDYKTVDIILDLGFSVKKKERFILQDYRVEDELLQEAKAALIVLVGGHRVLVRVDKDESEEKWTARLYLYQPVNMEDIYEVLLDRRLPCVNKIMRGMEKLKYDAEYIKKVKNTGIPVYGGER